MTMTAQQLDDIITLYAAQELSPEDQKKLDTIKVLAEEIRAKEAVLLGAETARITRKAASAAVGTTAWVGERTAQVLLGFFQGLR